MNIKTVYCVFSRYETRNISGKKEFTQWFKKSDHYSHEDAEKEINSLKDISKQIDKSTKLKHEFEIREYDETLIAQPRLHRPKGRPKTISEDKLYAIIADLNNKNGIARIPNDIKLYLYNDYNAQGFIAKNFPYKWVRYWYDEDKNLYAILKNISDHIIY